MEAEEQRELVAEALERGAGILRLEPSWVARDFLPPGYRLDCVGLRDDQYEVGERGHICERWFASVTKAANRVGPVDEGLSYLKLESKEGLTLKAAIESAGDLIMGEVYAASHNGLGRLFKVYDFGSRIPYHMHLPRNYTQKLGLNSKEEAYYFPEGIDPGIHPETYFGVHPGIAEQKDYEILLPYLEAWDSAMILKHSRAYLLVPGEGFHLPSGVPHAPGTAVTLELQEDSDVMAMLQAVVGDNRIDKELLFKDLLPEDRVNGERFILGLIDWDISGDPYFYENRRLAPIMADEQEGGTEYWIFYNTPKFSGKRMVVKPGRTFNSTENGVYSLLVWKGRGKVDGIWVESGTPGMDELLVSHDRAVKPLEYENTGVTDLEIIKVFGPDINQAPLLPPYPAGG